MLGKLRVLFLYLLNYRYRIVGLAEIQVMINGATRIIISYVRRDLYSSIASLSPALWFVVP